MKDMNAIELFRTTFFTSPNVTLIPTMQGNCLLNDGYKIDEFGVRNDWDGKPISLAFGARAGTAENVNLENLAHEMAHFVEIDEARCFIGGWGLKVPKQYIMGHECTNSQTMQSTARECRVIAHQANLMEAMGYPLDVYDFTSALKWMHDWCYVPKSKKAGYHESDESRTRYCVRYINKFRAKPEYSFENFKKVWFERIEKLPSLWVNEAAYLEAAE